MELKSPNSLVAMDTKQNSYHKVSGPNSIQTVSVNSIHLAYGETEAQVGTHTDRLYNSPKQHLRIDSSTTSTWPTKNPDPRKLSTQTWEVARPGFEPTYLAHGLRSSGPIGRDCSKGDKRWAGAGKACHRLLEIDTLCLASP